MTTLQIIELIKQCEPVMINNPLHYYFTNSYKRDHLIDMIFYYTDNNDYIIQECEKLIKDTLIYTYTIFFISAFQNNNIEIAQYIINNYYSNLDKKELYEHCYKKYCLYLEDFPEDEREINIFTTKYKMIVENNLVCDTKNLLLWNHLMEFIPFSCFFDIGIWFINYHNIDFKKLSMIEQKSLITSILYYSSKDWINYLHLVYDINEIVEIVNMDWNKQFLLDITFNECLFSYSVLELIIQFDKEYDLVKQLIEQYAENINFENFDFNKFISALCVDYEHSKYCVFENCDQILKLVTKLCNCESISSETVSILTKRIFSNDICNYHNSCECIIELIKYIISKSMLTNEQCYDDYQNSRSCWICATENGERKQLSQSHQRDFSYSSIKWAINNAKENNYRPSYNIKTILLHVSLPEKVVNNQINFLSSRPDHEITSKFVKMLNNEKDLILPFIKKYGCYKGNIDKIIKFFSTSNIMIENETKLEIIKYFLNFSNCKYKKKYGDVNDFFVVKDTFIDVFNENLKELINYCLQKGRNFHSIMELTKNIDMKTLYSDEEWKTLFRSCLNNEYNIKTLGYLIIKYGLIDMEENEIITIFKYWYNNSGTYIIVLLLERYAEIIKNAIKNNIIILSDNDIFNIDHVQNSFVHDLFNLF